MNRILAKTLLRPVVWVIYAALAAGLLYGIGYLVQLNGPTYFAQAILDGLRLGFVYALIALGYTMVYGIVRLINFAHGDVFMVGAFASYYAVARYGWSFVPAILFAMVICLLLNIVIERVAYKPLREAPRIASLITAIGVSFFLESFTALRFAFSADYITYKRPFEVTVWKFWGLSITNATVIIVGVTLALVLGLQYVIRRTKIGKAMRATSLDKSAARLMGINVDGVITFTFALGAALAGAAGTLYAIAFPQIWTFMGIMPGLKAFTAAVLGGIGSVPGAFVGSLLMGTVDVLVVSFLPLGSRLRDLFAFLVLIVVFLVKPTGIFGEPQVEKV
ncbi:MAG: branched-chain amino acid ABC transporter permease [Chloroflexi bacterium]|nr:branched-chain amino acid ABC transporter permease [Chloroflexota bacterium]